MFRCDFCGKEVEIVKRVALDRNYDRLSIKHQVKYACEECSSRKEKERRLSKPTTTRVDKNS